MFAEEAPRSQLLHGIVGALDVEHDGRAGADGLRITLVVALPAGGGTKPALRAPFEWCALDTPALGLSALDLQRVRTRRLSTVFMGV